MRFALKVWKAYFLHLSERLQIQKIRYRLIAKPPTEVFDFHINQCFFHLRTCRCKPVHFIINGNSVKIFKLWKLRWNNRDLFVVCCMLLWERLVIWLVLQKMFWNGCCLQIPHPINSQPKMFSVCFGKTQFILVFQGLFCKIDFFV